MRKDFYFYFIFLMLTGISPVKAQTEPALDDGYYLIENAEHLKWFRDKVNSTTVVDAESDDRKISTISAKLTADVELSGNWTPIGAYHGEPDIAYAGTFDGQGHTISGLTVNEISGRESYGLFGYIWKGSVKNLGIVNSTIKGTDYVGSICGMLGNGTIDNCFSTATVIGTDADSQVGGLSGGLRKTSIIKNSYNAGTVTATGSGSPSVGGISGYIGSESLVKNCYNAGMLSAVSEEAAIGGITGNDYSGNSTLSLTKAGEEAGLINCYYLEGTGSGVQAQALSASDFVTTINSGLFGGDNTYWQGTASVANDQLLIPTFQEDYTVQIPSSPTAIDKVADVANNIRVLDGRICITTSETVSMRIVNFAGQAVRNVQLSAGYNEVSGLPEGLYIVTLNDGTRSKVLIR
ncbi:hypothetical protein [Parabacteroides sp. AM08-6]|uniref:hypothetical protein n=1 Tax=Parabacteroides sp. AM08-6 TaxID=2292053 RepID=UPI000EFFA3F0|nr:hypothetical protein [Parabacteroides sp. AM08-6]RHJ86666.1 hypothetical protein DW103_03170 [Parabacteroides sp. AM08-6]